MLLDFVVECHLDMDNWDNLKLFGRIRRFEDHTFVRKDNSFQGIHIRIVSGQIAVERRIVEQFDNRIHKECHWILDYLDTFVVLCIRIDRNWRFLLDFLDKDHWDNPAEVGGEMGWN